MSFASIVMLLLIPNAVLWPTPVSYTHLDVYKRQFIRSKMARSFDVRGAEVALSLIHI